MKNIVVAMDSSEDSRVGIELGAMVASTLKSKLWLAHVVNELQVNVPIKSAYASDNPFPNVENAENAEAIDFNRILANDLLQRYPQLESVNDEVLNGNMYKEITQFAQTFPNPLIVTTTNKETNFERIFISSNTYKMVTRATCPVLTIRNHRKVTPVKQIIMPIDLSINTRQKIGITAQIAAKFKAKVFILGVSMEYSTLNHLEKYVEQASKYLASHNISFESEIAHSHNETNLVLEYAEKIHADLISIMTKQEESVANIFTGSNAHLMINKSSIPVLCVNTKEFYIRDETFLTQG